MLYFALTDLLSLASCYESMMGSLYRFGAVLAVIVQVPCFGVGSSESLDSDCGLERSIPRPQKPDFFQSSVSCLICFGINMRTAWLFPLDA